MTPPKATMNNDELFQRFIAFCHRLYERRYVVAHEGNVSALMADGSLLVTPTGMCKGDIAVDDLVVIDRGGKKISGERDPSSEIKMHLLAYNGRPDVRAVVHAHPPIATGFAVAGRSLPDRVLPETVVALGPVPIVPYGTPGTAELPDRIQPLLKNANAFLLANHGVLTVGEDLDQAYYRLETVEQVAHTMLVAEVLGGAKELSAAQIQALLELKKDS